MKIDKKDFHKTCLSMAAGSPDAETERSYIQYITTFTSYLVMRFNMNRHREDYMQDVIEYIFRTKMHEKVDDKKNAFNLYWTSISRHLWLLQKRERKKFAMPLSNLYTRGDSEQSSEDIGDNIMLKNLGFSLEDYVIEEELPSVDITQLDKVVAGKPTSKRGRKKSLYWKEMYKKLRENKTMTEAELVRMLPVEKREKLKDPSKSVLQNIRLLANKDGYKVSVSDTGVNKIYMIIGG